MPAPAALDPEERIGPLLAHLGTAPEGLGREEAARRLRQHGPNEIRRREGAGHARALLAQFTHPLAVLLWVAARARWSGGSPRWPWRSSR